MSNNCLYLQYFSNIGTVGNSSGIVKPSTIHGTSRTFTHDRPFVPLYGVAESPGGSGFHVPLAIATQKANIPDVFRALAVSMFNASRWAADNSFGGTATFSSSKRFDKYLWNKIGADVLMLNRYKAIFELVIDFWNNLDAAATAQAYQDQLTKLRDLVLTQADKELYAAPGAYIFTNADAFTIAYNAWLAADATLVGFVGLEINSIS